MRVISIVLPTYNESGNLEQLFTKIAEVAGKRAIEVIVVDDDSPDRTWDLAEKLKKKFPFVRVLRRVGRRGLSSAVIEGFGMAKGDVLLVMDADLQHDPSLITQLADHIEQGADIAVASRYMKGGSVGDWVKSRRILSNAATVLARNLPKVEVSDPMSGFFALRRSSYERIADQLRPTGFKILLEVLSQLPRDAQKAEVPLHFRQRLSGESKLSMRVQLQFLIQLIRITLLRFHLWLFVIVAITVAIPLSVVTWRLHPLYLDSGNRGRVETVLKELMQAHGWLASDVELQQVWSDHMIIGYRPHHFGKDTNDQCYLIEFYNPVLQPCND